MMTVAILLGSAALGVVAGLAAVWWQVVYGNDHILPF